MRGLPVCLRALTAEEASAVQTLASALNGSERKG
jgi:hypothetical protein